MKKLKIPALVLVLVLLASLALTACGDDSSSGSTSQSGSTGQTSSQTSTDDGNDNPYAEHLTIKWMALNAGGFLPEMGSDAQKLIEEKFNVTIEPAQVDLFNNEQWSLFWAEGNTADLVTTPGQAGPMYQLVEQGLLRTIDEAWLYEYMPTWMSKVKGNVGEDVVNAQLKYKGDNYFVPFKNYASTQTIIMALRQDWMDAVGVSSIPTTLDELHDLLLKFSTEDPDGNGVNDTYGLDPILWNNGFNYVAGAFGVMPNAYYNDNGKVSFSMATEGWKDFLREMAVWYQEGIIDPEFPTDDRNLQRQKWSEGKIGALMDHPWWFAQSTNGSLQEQLYTQNPDAKVVFTPEIQGPGGAGGYLLFPDVAQQGAMFFGKDTTDEQVIRIMQIKEYLCTDWDFFVRLYYGVEGENYEINDEGIIALIPDANAAEDNNAKGIGNYYGIIPLDNNDFPKFTSAADMPPYEISMSNNGIYGDTAAFPDAGTNTAKIERGGDVTGVANAYCFDVIAGNKDIDATWDAYLAELDTAGLADIIRGYEEMLAG